MYDSWLTAATNIQEAVDAADSGDTVLVAGGIYDIGGRTVGTGMLTNRVVIDKPITVESLMGPEVTVIEGAKAPGGGNGDGAIRCVHLGDGAILSGFTLTNGATRIEGDWPADCRGGGVWCESQTALASNCVIIGNSAQSGGGAYSGTLNDCILTGNSAGSGGGAWWSKLDNCTLTGNSASGSAGGAHGGVLNNCTLTGNSASDGGGAYSGTLNNCTLTGNSASGSAGGAHGGVLNNCTLTGNSADTGGGVAHCTLYNCVLNRNSARRGGGGGGWPIYVTDGFGNKVLKAPAGEFNNCMISDNSAAEVGGGVYGGGLLNCTLTGNTATTGGAVAGLDPGNFADGGIRCILTNCIVYDNSATNGPNYHIASLSYSCTTPMPTNGIGNITNEPAFVNPAAGDFHLRYGSPCIDAGTNLSPILTNDLDGRPRPLDGNRDGIAAFDMGAYECTPLARYVWQDSPSPASPFTNWTAAAHSIQEAVDAAIAGDIVLVTNGVYATGGKAVYGTMTNRVAVDKPITLQSVTDPANTIIQGYQVPGATNGDGAIRCVYLAEGAVLSGFTLTNGATRGWNGDWSDGVNHMDHNGGGVWCESSNATVSNCVLTMNAAALVGGGAYSGTLNNCILTGNSASQSGGGAAGSTLVGCTLTDNWAVIEGGGSGPIYCV